MSCHYKAMYLLWPILRLKIVVNSGVAIMEQMEQVFQPDFTGSFYSAENALKFAYSKVEFQKNVGGNTPHPRFSVRGRKIVSH